MAAIVVSLLALGACATPYQRSGLSGGFDEMDLGRDVWRVGFGGNGYSTLETVQTYWLYRCSELALEKGYDGFEILSQIQLAWNVPAEQLFSPEAGDVRYRPAQMVFIPMDSVAKPAIEADVLMLRAPLEHAPPKRFDARVLKDALEPYVKGKKEGVGNVQPHIHEYLYPDKKLGDPKQGPT